jgi:hypothetical protein
MYVSSYVLILYMCWYYICVLILLCMCPHTAIYVSSYCYICVDIQPYPTHSNFVLCEVVDTDAKGLVDYLRKKGAYARVCWRIRAYADVCWRLVDYLRKRGAYAHVCWRMLTYADVCWRMLTYARRKGLGWLSSFFSKEEKGCLCVPYMCSNTKCVSPLSYWEREREREREREGIHTRQHPALAHCYCICVRMLVRLDVSSHYSTTMCVLKLFFFFSRARFGVLLLYVSSY